MRNAAHLPSSPHFNDVADIVADLKAFVSKVNAASAEKATCRKQHNNDYNNNNDYDDDNDYNNNDDYNDDNNNADMWRTSMC
jgi:hypothetical protein